MFFFENLIVFNGVIQMKGRSFLKCIRFSTLDIRRAIIMKTRRSRSGKTLSYTYGIIVAIFVVYRLNACLYCFETNRETRSTHRILHGARLQYKPCNTQCRLRSIKCAYFTGQTNHERSAHVYV